MSLDDLAACRRMRACLAGILDLDPAGVTARLADMDREIARLERLLGRESPEREATHRIEVIPIGSPLSVKAA